MDSQPNNFFVIAVPWNGPNYQMSLAPNDI